MSQEATATPLTQPLATMMQTPTAKYHAMIKAAILSTNAVTTVGRLTATRGASGAKGGAVARLGAGMSVAGAVLKVVAHQDAALAMRMTAEPAAVPRE